MEFVTAKKGTPHFTSEQFRTILTAMCGDGTYIADLYEQLEPELAANNTVKIRSGCLMHHGGVFLVNQGTYDEVTYQNGTQGMKRIDLVVVRYTKDAETGIENGEWVVIQGTPAAENPVAPEYTVGNMQAGDLVDDCPLFEIHLNGINVTKVKKLIEKPTNIRNEVAQLSNPNLLINGDFRVNQRGATSYEKTSTTKYTVDRWKANAGMVVTVNENSITVTNQGTSDLYFSQPFEKALNGTYTYSCNVLNISGVAWLYNFHTFKLSKGLNTKTVTDELTSFTFGLEAGASIEIEWAKLEQGTVATPFVPRLIGEEWLLCQRYYQVLQSTLPQLFHEECKADTTYIFVRETLSPPMRSTPTVVKSDVYNHSSTRVAGVSNAQITNDVVAYVKLDSSFATGRYFLYMVLDAEIY